VAQDRSKGLTCRAAVSPLRCCFAASPSNLPATAEPQQAGKAESPEERAARLEMESLASEERQRREAVG
jgi:hypothetical protein